MSFTMWLFQTFMLLMLPFKLKSKKSLLPCLIDKSANWLCILKTILESHQVLLSITNRSNSCHLLQVLDVAWQGQDIQVVVQEDAGVVRCQTQDESFIESVNHILMSLSSKSMKCKKWRRIVLMFKSMSFIYKDKLTSELAFRFLKWFQI